MPHYNMKEWTGKMVAKKWWTILFYIQPAYVYLCKVNSIFVSLDGDPLTMQMSHLAVEAKW